MRRSIALCVSLAIAGLLGGCTSQATAPGKPGAPTLTVLGATSFASGDVFQALPPGDMIMTVDAGTLINTTIPGILSNQPDHKAKFDADMKEAIEKTGVDPKQLKLVAVSLKFPVGGKGDPQFAALLTGTFDSTKLTESLKKDPKTGVERKTEDYNGKTIYILDKPSDGTSTPAADPAQQGGITLLDPSTLAFGGPIASLKAAIDAQGKTADNATKDTDLFSAFKSTKESSLMRFALRVPADQMKKESSNPMEASFSAAKYFFGSLDGANGLSVDLTARAATAEDAKPMYDSLTKMLDEGKTKMAGQEQLKSILSVLEKTTVTSDGADVKVSMNIPSDTMNQIAKDMGQMFGGMMGGPGMDHGGMHGSQNDMGHPDGSEHEKNDDN